MRVTRVYRFAASHRLHTASLSKEENAELYGKCNNPHGHGHDYVLHISVTGAADPQTGRVLNVGALDRHVQQRVLDVYDGNDLNRDVCGFQGVPTTENLAADTESRLREGWPFVNASLDSVLIQETGRNTVELKKAMVTE